MIALLALLAAVLPASGVAHAATRPNVESPHGSFREECGLCHGATGWKPARVSSRFDHGKFGFALEGAHAAAACMSCHTTLEFSQSRTQCQSCHADPHRGEMGLDCARCHGARSFHDRARMARAHQQSQFPLSGAHKVLDCESCHRAAGQGKMQFVNTRADCQSCHLDAYRAVKQPDHVQGGFPLTCQSCHGAESWSTASFDHERTAFPLTGAHTRTACASCHTGSRFTGLATTCQSCHQADYDRATPNHAASGFSASACATCHGTAAFTGARFDHNTTQFPLTGAHRTAACAGCHSSGVYDGLATACQSCHQGDFTSAAPNHAAAGFQAAQCATCHTTAAWTGGVFNHATTSFPLTGSHTTATCVSCHTGTVFNNLASTCQSCHMTEYNRATPNHVSSGFAASVCATCHNTTAFAGATFDHNTTSFPLTGAHRLPGCNSCHSSGVYDGLATACQSCHQSDFNVAVPNHAAAGFQAAQCATCHTTTSFIGGAFDHATTSYPLTGSHARATCVGCHTGTVFNNLTTACQSCHMTDYNAATPNHASSGFSASACATCHNTTTFTGATFDHNTTSFPLTGAHRTAACNTCHSSGVYDGLATTCQSCHQSDFSAAVPSHAAAGFQAAQCATCHTTAAWTGGVFNHATTSFPLTGSHTTATCVSCHTGTVFNNLASTCQSCHMTEYNAATPNHASSGFAASACATCHNTTTFTGATFDHNTTQFPLTGAHRTAACNTCHSSGVYDGLATTCQSCHQSDFSAAVPSHAAAGFQAAQCATCHTTAAWTGGVFNHATTSFPLTGSHTTATCVSCHTGTVFNNLASTCQSCHMTEYNAATPNHASSGFAASACATCHNTTTFTGATFDHNTTSFPLTGAHRTAACNTCHSSGVYDGLATTCQSCHQSDFSAAVPNHAAAGFQAAQCATCHTTAAWTGGVFNHATTSFPLTGSHTTATCVSCHTGTVFNNLASACQSCHMTEYNAATPNHASSGFSASACATCHNTTTFTGATFDHNTTSFPLTGAHRTAACNTCHSSGVYDGLATTCQSCHQSDFSAAVPNHAAAGFQAAQCATCHTTVAWTGGVFNHATTSFPLTGSHTTATCVSCHTGTVFNNLASACQSCHMTEYNAATPNHTTAGFSASACATCHTTTTWSGATFDHDARFFPIYSGRHRGRWTDCATCHTNSSNYAVYTCLSCHPHDNRTETDNDHRGRSGYTYDSAACYRCHPRGNS